MTREITPEGIRFIQQSEGFKLEAYQDGAGIWTIGYGHTRGVQPGMHITADEAGQCLREDLLAAEAAVESATEGRAPGDDQFAAMVSLCFNIGQANFRGSSVARLHAQGNFAQAADAFLLWNKITVQGALQVSPGLANRRERERSFYLQA